MKRLFFRPMAVIFYIEWDLAHFPRKRKAAIPGQAQKCPLTPRGLQNTIGPGGMYWHALSRPMRVAGHLATGRITCMILPFFIRWGVDPIYMMLLVNASGWPS